MFVDCDQDTGMPLSGHVSVGHRTLASIRADGFEVMRTRRGVPCTEIHHSAPFCIVWPKANEVSACDEGDGEYWTVFGMATIDDDDLIEFDAVLDCDMAALGFTQVTRRVWCNEAKGWRDVVVSFGTADSADADTASKPG